MIFLLGFFIAFCLALLSTPLVIKLAQRYKILDFPKRPHPAILHDLPIPRAGGLPPLFAFVTTLFTLTNLGIFTISKPVIGIIIASMVLVGVGLWDDKLDLNPYFRLLTNVLVVLIVVGFGIGISSITNPLGGILKLDSLVLHFSLPGYFGLLSGSHSIVVWADLVAFFWIIWIMNALNWSSGVDGQLTGIAVIALTIVGVASVQLLSNDPTQRNVAILAFSGAGAFLGFLPWSFYPQKIMPGYGGATLAGFLIAVLAIIAGAKLAIILLILLVPLVDSLWAVLRRVLSRRSPVWGDRNHLHHQLLALGWTIPQICFFYYSVGLILGLASLNFDSQRKFFVIVTLGSLIFAFLLTSFIILKKVKQR